MKEVQAIQQFNFNGFEIRMELTDDGNPLFLAKDVCDVLGYSNNRKAIADHCKVDGVTKRYTVDSLGRKNEGVFINEANLYRLIIKSSKPEAEQFERFVMEEILPSVRKHGVYATSETIDSILANPDNMIKLLSTLKEERAQRQVLELENQSKEYTIKQLAPKALYTEKVLESVSGHQTTLIAKELNMSAMSLNKKLRERGIQYKVGGTWVLSSKFMNKGYTQTNTYRETINGEERTYLSTVWTEKGRMFIHSLFNDTLKIN